MGLLYLALRLLDGIISEFGGARERTCCCSKMSICISRYVSTYSVGVMKYVIHIAMLIIKSDKLPYNLIGVLKVVRYAFNQIWSGLGWAAPPLVFLLPSTFTVS